MRTITTLEARKRSKPNLAGYVRVSRVSDEMQASYTAQIDEWDERFSQDTEVNFVKVFGDYGISGHKTTQREEFQEMVDMAVRGEIDIIVTKSISRFGRNTQETKRVTAITQRTRCRGAL